MFNRSVSALNDSIYGIQPTKAQYISGITLEDLEPLSTNHSLCAETYFLNNNIDALKFFAQRPFVPCSSIANRDEIATNPLAVYLTPVTISAEESAEDEISANDSYEWVFVFNSDVSVDWETIKQYADGKHYLSAAVAEGLGKWELIGSTSLTDEKVSALFADVYDTIYTIAEELSAGTISGLSNEVSRAISAEAALQEAIDIEVSARISAVDEEKTRAESREDALELSSNKISVAFDEYVESNDAAIDSILTSVLPELSAEITGTIEAISTDLSNSMSAFVLSTDYNSFVGSTETKIDGPCSAIESVSGEAFTNIEALTLSASNLCGVIDSVLTSDIPGLSSRLVLDISSVSSDLRDIISVVDSSLCTNIDAIMDKLSNEINPRISAISNDIVLEVERIDEISVKLSDETAALSDAIDNVLTSSLPELRADLTSTVNVVSSDLCSAIEVLSNDASESLMSLELSVSQISTDFDDFAKTITDELSNEINPKISSIADCVSSEVLRVDGISENLDSVLSSLSNYVETATAQTITGKKTFDGGLEINGSYDESIKNKFTVYGDSPSIKIVDTVNVNNATSGYYRAGAVRYDLENGDQLAYTGDGIWKHSDDLDRDFSIAFPNDSGTVATEEWAASKFLSALPSHTHDISSITNLQAALDSKLSGVKMNNLDMFVTNGVADLGTVLTAHQSLAEYTPLSVTNGLSNEVVNGLSNTVNPKLDVISGLVKQEMEKLDEISGKLSGVEYDISSKYWHLSGTYETCNSEQAAIGELSSREIYTDTIHANEYPGYEIDFRNGLLDSGEAILPWTIEGGVNVTYGAISALSVLCKDTLTATETSSNRSVAKELSAIDRFNAPGISAYEYGLGGPYLEVNANSLTTQYLETPGISSRFEGTFIKDAYITANALNIDGISASTGMLYIDADVLRAPGMDIGGGKVGLSATEFMAPGITAATDWTTGTKIDCDSITADCLYATSADLTASGLTSDSYGGTRISATFAILPGLSTSMNGEKANLDIENLTASTYNGYGLSIHSSYNYDDVELKASSISTDSFFAPGISSEHNGYIKINVDSLSAPGLTANYGGMGFGYLYGNFSGLSAYDACLTANGLTANNYGTSVSANYLTANSLYLNGLRMPGLTADDQYHTMEISSTALTAPGLTAGTGWYGSSTSISANYITADWLSAKQFHTTGLTSNNYGDGQDWLEISANSLTAPNAIISRYTPHSGLSVTGIDFGDGTYLSTTNGMPYLPLSGGSISIYGYSGLSVSEDGIKNDILTCGLDNNRYRNVLRLLRGAYNNPMIILEDQLSIAGGGDMYHPFPYGYIAFGDGTVISSGNQFVPLSAYQALESRVSALESRLSDIETIVDQINGTTH